MSSPPRRTLFKANEFLAVLETGESHIPYLSPVTLGVILIIAGVLLALFVVILSIAKTDNVKARGGAVVIVGPFPIIFGSDRESAKVLLVLSIVLVAALIVLLLLQGYF
ncbi:DUF131 domain-containing protein [Candidatus Bathyarchaeota archaeon]|nr:MAG: DUF131 domain-containing protein [Candidatus Bathyarchaeota archaeon]